jgi:hypothetical protein
MKFLESIADMIGPAIVSKEIEHNGVKRTFHFRKVSGEEADNLLLTLLDDEGKYDRAKMKGNVGRELAVVLVDENGKTIATADEINSLPGALRAKLDAASKEVNGVNEKKDLPVVNSSGSTSPQSSDTQSAS